MALARALCAAASLLFALLAAVSAAVGFGASSLFRFPRRRPKELLHRSERVVEARLSSLGPRPPGVSCGWVAVGGAVGATLEEAKPTCSRRGEVRVASCLS